jgi:phage virion morphogenesis protein
MAGQGAGGVSLTLRAPELREVEARLGRLASGMRAPVQLMRIIGAVLESSTRVRFRSNLSPEGRPWKPSIRAATRGGVTLTDKGHLRDSITHDADETRAVVGTNLIYAAIHQVGGVIRPKAGGYLTFKIPGVGWRKVRQVTIPARPYLGVSESDRTEISAQVERYIERLAA